MSEDFMRDNANLASNVSGVLVIDKPTGMTSHDVVQVVRNGTHIRRAGHTGTLDPRASGVLVVLVGPAVRLSEFISASEKRYQAVLRLGLTTDTYDMDGNVLMSSPVNISYEELEETLKHSLESLTRFRRHILQSRSMGKKPTNAHAAGKRWRWNHARCA